jgi:hypothetical protein
MKRNNPGNIRTFVDDEGNYSKPFYGEIEPDIKPGATAGFRVFDSQGSGYRAMFRLLKSAYLDKGYNTIRKLIPKYAPAGDNNNPNHYINFVEAQSKIPRDRILSNYNDLVPIVRAMVEMEQGEKPIDANLQIGFDAINNPLLLVQDIIATPGTPGTKKNKYVAPLLIGAGLLTTILIVRHYAKKKSNFSR